MARPTDLVARVLREDDRALFNGFVAAFPTGDLLQSWEWGDLKAKTGWRPTRVICERNGTPVAAALLLARPIPRTGKCIVYAPRGPVLDTTDGDLVREVATALRRIARERGGILLKIDPPVEAADGTSRQSLESAGFQLLNLGGFGGTQPKCVMQLDLDKDEDALLASFHQKWRYNIRLADRKGVQVDIDAPRHDLPIFYELLRETTARDGFTVRSLRYFEDMFDLLAPSGSLKLVLARYEGTPVAGAIVLIFGDRAWYLYGASSNLHRNVMPNHLMQWRAIQYCMSRGCRWYDFRGVSPRKGDGSDDHLQGLNRFKEGFSPRFVEYLGEMDMVISPMWYRAWNAAQAGRSWLKRRRGGNRHGSDDG